MQKKLPAPPSSLLLAESSPSARPAMAERTRLRRNSLEIPIWVSGISYKWYKWHKMKEKNLLQVDLGEESHVLVSHLLAQIILKKMSECRLDFANLFWTDSHGQWPWPSFRWRVTLLITSLSKLWRKLKKTSSSFLSGDDSINIVMLLWNNYPMTKWLWQDEKDNKRILTVWWRYRPSSWQRQGQAPLPRIQQAAV